MICKQVGLRIKNKKKWMSDKSPGLDSWNVVWVVQNEY